MQVTRLMPFAAALLCAAAGVAAPAQAKIVARDISIVMDKVGPGNEAQMGKTHEARIYYDDAKIDPKTKRVRILHEQHTPMQIPAHPDPVTMPVDNAWLDLSAQPYRYHLAASPGVAPGPNGKTMWAPYAIVFDADSRRMTIRKQSDGSLELSGAYTVGEPMSGPKIDEVIYGKSPVPAEPVWPQ